MGGLLWLFARDGALVQEDGCDAGEVQCAEEVYFDGMGLRDLRISDCSVNVLLATLT